MTPFLAAALLACVPAGADAHYTAVDDRTVLIEARRSWFKLTTLPTAQLADPFATFVNVVRGPSTLCGRLDFDLSVVSPPGGAPVPLLVQDFQPISEAEAKALRTRPKR